MAWKQYPEAEMRGDENGNVEALIGNVWTQISSGGAANVVDGYIDAGGNFVQAGEPEIAAKNIFLGFAIGIDATPETLTANTLKDGSVVDISEMNKAMRSLVIINQDSSPSFAYRVLFGRNTIKANAYQVVSDTSTAEFTAADLTANYDLYAFVEITPDVGQSGDQLDFQAYIVGRGA